LFFRYTLRVTKNEAAVHTSDSGSSETYKHLNLNDIVEVVEQRGTWFKIKDGATYGWIWDQYVSTDLTPEKILYKLRVTKDEAAVHISDSGSSDTYKHLKFNDIVEVVEQKGTWYKIKDGTTYGWIWDQHFVGEREYRLLYFPAFFLPGTIHRMIFGSLYYSDLLNYCLKIYLKRGKRLFISIFFHLLNNLFTFIP